MTPFMTGYPKNGCQFIDNPSPVIKNDLYSGILPERKFISIFASKGYIKRGFFWVSQQGK
jgi:hypothetical protein